MTKSTETQIINHINQPNLTQQESLQLIDNLYWADWDLLSSEYPDHIDKIFHHINNNNHTKNELSQILKLYNNPDGAYVEEFAQVIIEMYKKDKTLFIQALALERDETANLVYIFRNNDIKLDEDKELLDIISSSNLSEEEADTGEKLIKMYENICNT